jgi:hypothetical protein
VVFDAGRSERVLRSDHQVIFNTDPRLPGSSDMRHDLAIWAEPHILERPAFDPPSGHD